MQVCAWPLAVRSSLVELAIDNHHSFKELVVVVYSWQLNCKLSLRLSYRLIAYSLVYCYALRAKPKPKAKP
jgi:hypothetical protein